jgi:hypothetical protein
METLYMEYTDEISAVIIVGDRTTHITTKKKGFIPNIKTYRDVIPNVFRDKETKWLPIVKMPLIEYVPMSLIEHKPTLQIGYSPM